MKTLRLFIVLTVVSLGLLPADLPAATIVFNNTNGNNLWTEADNWDLDRVPNSSPDSDTVNLAGFAVSVTGEASFNVFTTGGGSVSVDNGGVLTGTGNYALRYVNVTINDGGIFNAGLFTIRNVVDINEGGAMNGGTGIGLVDSRTITVDGEFSPRGTTLASGLAFQLGSGTPGPPDTNKTGVLNQSATGKVLLDVYSNGSNEYFDIVGLTSGTQLNLNGTVELRLQGGYTPSVGDSFDLWNMLEGSAAVRTLDSTTITLPGYELDTSAWTTTGVVTVVPEPASVALLLLGAVPVLLRRRR